MEFLDVESFSFDEEKNLTIETVDGSHHVLEAETVIFAVGQRAVIPEGFGLETANGLVEGSIPILSPPTGTRCLPQGMQLPGPRR